MTSPANAQVAKCWCCGKPAPIRGEDDPWEGRLDGYCNDCALARCDAFPGGHREAADSVVLSREDAETIRARFEEILFELRVGHERGDGRANLGNVESWCEEALALLPRTEKES